MDDYLSKPLSQSQLANVLSKWLTQATGVAGRPEAAEQEQLDSVSDSPPAMDVSINRQALDNILNLQGGEAILDKVIHIYLDESPLILGEMHEAVALNQPDVMYKAAHKFKSSSANLGAERLAELCKELEALGRAGSTNGAERLLDEISSMYELTQAALTEEFLESLV
jgi:HPt (histidine-containing phosphotransfer) domain-containing protein